MFVYNITYKVDNDIAMQWMQWQKEIHIPALLNTHCFYKHLFFELIEPDDIDGRTFVIQFLAKDLKDYDQYIFHHATALRDEFINKWGNQIITFRTVLKAID